MKSLTHSSRIWTKLHMKLWKISIEWRNQSRNIPSKQTEVIRNRNIMMTRCLRAASHVISVGEKNRRGKANCATWTVFVEHVERRTTLRSSAVQERKRRLWIWRRQNQRGRIPLLCDLRARVDKHRQQRLGTWNSCTDAYRWKPIKFHIDCGATVNVLPVKYVNKEDIQLTKCVLQMWNRTELKPEGICCLTMHNPRNWKNTQWGSLLLRRISGLDTVTVAS